MLFHKLGIQNWFNCIESDENPQDWEELLGMFEALGKKSEILTLTSKETNDIWQFADRFNKLMSGAFCPRETNAMPLIVKLFVERECQILGQFDEIIDETTRDFFVLDDLLDDKALVKYCPKTNSEWLLFQEESHYKNNLVKVTVLSKFQRFASEYDKFSRGELESREKLKSEYEKIISSLHAKITEIESSKRQRTESHNDLSGELQLIFDLVCGNTSDKSLLDLRESVSKKQSRHEILKHAFQLYLESEKDKLLTRRHSAELSSKFAELDRQLAHLHQEKVKLEQLKWEIAEDTEYSNIEKSRTSASLAEKSRNYEELLIKTQADARAHAQEREKLQEQIRVLEKSLESARNEIKTLKLTPPPVSKPESLQVHQKAKIRDILQEVGSKKLSISLIEVFNVHCKGGFPNEKLKKIYEAINTKHHREKLLVQLFDKYLVKQLNPV